ncbi:MAG: hypothetical protein V1816_17775 [Pseudomonadota bacterium]
MKLVLTCYYCGAKKEIEPGKTVNLSCDLCKSPKIVLNANAVFRCLLCGRFFRLPAGRQVWAWHDEEDCLGRLLVLVDFQPQ